MCVRFLRSDAGDDSTPPLSGDFKGAMYSHRTDKVSCRVPLAPTSCTRSLSPPLSRVLTFVGVLLPASARRAGEVPRLWSLDCQVIQSMPPVPQLRSCTQVHASTASIHLHRTAGDSECLPTHARTPDALPSSRSSAASSLQRTPFDNSCHTIRYQCIVCETGEEEGLFRVGSDARSVSVEVRFG
jgi:hypothetical protein